jgi:hypothetical protein
MTNAPAVEHVVVDVLLLAMAPMCANRRHMTSADPHARTHARQCSGALTRAAARYVFTFSSNFGRLPFFIKAFYSRCAAAVALDNIYISGQGQACAVPVLSMSRVRCMPLAGGTPDLVYLHACNAGDCSRGRWLLEHHYRCGACVMLMMMC